MRVELPLARAGGSAGATRDSPRRARYAAESMGPWVLAGVAALLAATVAAAWARGARAAAERARTRAEQERSALARRLEQLARFARDMVFLADDQQRLVTVNERALALLGYTREELVGRSVRELRNPTTLGDYDARVAEQVDGGPRSSRRGTAARTGRPSRSR